MAKQISLVFLILAMLIACVGLQSTTSPTPNANYAASSTAYAEATLGTPNAYSMTQDAIGLTRTAYILSVPTLSAEERQVLRQTQDQLMATEYAYATQFTLNRTEHYANLTAIAAGTDPFILTETLYTPTRTTENRLITGDDFSLTATSIIATATANAVAESSATPRVYISATPCPEYAWTRTIFQYDERLAENWMENPDIREVTSAYCNIYMTRFISHAIVIHPSFPLEETDTEQFYRILEDAVSRLPEYPPHQPEVSELIELDFMEKGNWPSGSFTYSAAIAAYQQGLRGEALAEALDIWMPLLFP